MKKLVLLSLAVGVYMAEMVLQSLAVGIYMEKLWWPTLPVNAQLWWRQLWQNLRRRLRFLTL